MKRFPAALVLAPLAGAFAAFLPVAIGGVVAGIDYPRTLVGAVRGAFFISVLALPICLLYAAAVASAAYVYARLRGRELSLLLAVTISVVVGVLPWSIAVLAGWNISQRIASMTLLCSLVTAWIFWRVALAPRAAA
jgi:hypothetical protein